MDNTSISDIKVGDKITIEGLNILPDGSFRMGKKKKTGRKKQPAILTIKSSNN